MNYDNCEYTLIESVDREKFNKRLNELIKSTLKHEVIAFDALVCSADYDVLYVALVKYINKGDKNESC